jgi:hypothetical protein
MKYKYLNKKEEEQVVIDILDVLLDKNLIVAGEKRKQQWEKGWDENLKTGDINPKYFGKYNIFRLNGRFIFSNEKGFEQKMLYKLVDEMVKKYLNKLEVVCEFGCGTGHNLLRMKKIIPDTHLIGLDWTESSQKILAQYDVDGHNFNFFNPKFNLQKGSGVITIVALEQTGKKYKKFVQFLLKKKPSIVVHIEPIPELLDSTKLIDYLSIQYMHKRGYLNGYLDYLKELQKQGKIKILEARRSGIGSKLIDGYSIIAWKPNN